MTVCIIGVGNDYRGDDGAGLAVARVLKAMALPANIDIIEASGEATGLLEAWQGAEVVLVLDAVLSGATPGTLHRFDAHAQRIETTLFSCSTHAFGVAEAVELARALDQLPPRLLVYGIEGQEFSMGAPITPAVAEALPRLAQRIAEEARGVA
jgi:hydrogenase maturation protease